MLSSLLITGVALASFATAAPPSYNSTLGHELLRDCGTFMSASDILKVEAKFAQYQASHNETQPSKHDVGGGPQTLAVVTKQIPVYFHVIYSTTCEFQAAY